MRHFYHLYCAAPWRAIAGSHLDALQAAGCDWRVTAGIVGAPAERRKARELFSERFPQTTFIEADEGWEQLTLRRLHAWAKQAPSAEPVLYAHSKGVTHRPGDGRHGLYAAAWRTSMTRQVIGGWDHCVRLLREYDVVGCHWLTPETYPEHIYVPFFGGNFWWANVRYLARLPEIGNETRHNAEDWIGLNDPHVFDLKPGWPTFGLFAREVITQLNPAAEVLVS